MAASNDAQIAMEQGMIIAEANIAIGAIDRILKMTKNGKSNNRELTNARSELDHWRSPALGGFSLCEWLSAGALGANANAPTDLATDPRASAAPAAA